jgi:hypothetical protein
LKYNIIDNKIEDKVQVLIGDCRILAKEHNLVNLVDRVSLGLLPSSEGGWKTAIRSLKQQSGGWLHVHGNVPVKEMKSWALWVCRRLRTFVEEEGMRDDWVVICNHIERVKSFAPTVSHYVADIFVGPLEWYDQMDDKQKLAIITSGGVGIIQSDSSCMPAPLDISPPTCALSSDGALSQEWMR